MKKRTLKIGFRKTVLTLSLVFTALGASAQTNVYDDVIATSPNHTSLAAAIQQEGLVSALQNPSATLTVFAPDNTAFENLATALNTNIAGLLALPNLSDILLYHVLGVTVDAAAVTNGAIVDPLNTANTIKMTKTSMGSVYANQAMVNGADLTADNGIVHSIDAVLLPYETVVDVAIDNGFTSLTTAVVTAELLPALTNPLAELTVFAPTNQAFDNLAVALGTDINGLLANPELADILLYHVVSGTVLSTGLSNGMVPTLNGQSVTVDLSTGVMINSSNVTLADLTADNGVVHVVDAVLVPSLAAIDEMDQGSILIYPNPATEILNVKFEGNKFKNLSIVDLNGKQIFTKLLEENSAELNISSIDSGSYILILDGKGINASTTLQKL
ncbi:MAG: fasciclin domain-containing protein [Crocinitomicaceae bacterium]|nr:fasciclin domain-containing protein [Crocinitomicaceae bacterium]MDG1775882.1 fasciclin domain-containing protein [Crocinitomicaceae bacterium]